MPEEEGKPAAEATTPSSKEATPKPTRREFAPVLHDFPEMQALLSEVLSGIELTMEPGIEELTVRLKPEDVVRACRLAKEDERLQFDFLRCLCGVDWPESNEIEVVYQLWSTQKQHKVTIKTRQPKSNAVFDSVTSAWKGAEWHERETAEMFGVTFAGHPDPRPLLLVEGLDEHPLLKSEPLVDILESYEDSLQR